MKTKQLNHFIPGAAVLEYKPQEHSKHENLKYIQKHIRLLKDTGGLGPYNAHHKTAAEVIKAIENFQVTIINTIGESDTGYTLLIHSVDNRMMICKGPYAKVGKIVTKVVDHA